MLPIGTSAKKNRTTLELFDLSNDALEGNNLIDDERYTSERNDLVTALSAWESDVLDWAVEKQHIELEDMDSKVVDELKGLGYIQ